MLITGMLKVNNIKLDNRSRSTMAYNKSYFVYHIWGLQPFWSSEQEKSNEYSIKQPSDF